VAHRARCIHRVQSNRFMFLYHDYAKIFVLVKKKVFYAIFFNLTWLYIKSKQKICGKGKKL